MFIQVFQGQTVDRRLTVGTQQAKTWMRRFFIHNGDGKIGNVLEKEGINICDRYFRVNGQPMWVKTDDRGRVGVLCM